LWYNLLRRIRCEQNFFLIGDLLRKVGVQKIADFKESLFAVIVVGSKPKPQVNSSEKSRRKKSSPEALKMK